MGPSLTILEKELVTGRDREELGLASRRSSSCPLPVLSKPGRGCGGEGGEEGQGEAVRALCPGGRPIWGARPPGVGWGGGRWAPHPSPWRRSQQPGLGQPR